MNNEIELTEKRFPLAEALKIASAVVEQLRPHCIRIEIAGSIRRKKPMVGDIEIVAIPKPFSSGLFASGIAAVADQWEKVKGDLVYQEKRYTQRILPEGITLDLFLADETNWGYIFAIRTGSADYSHLVLARGWVQRGFKGIGGYLCRDGEKVAVPEETDLFRIVGVPYAEPEDRNL